MAAECVRAGYVLSFAGTVTFKNAPALREAAAVVPLDQLLVETDAPFLTPMPYPGRPNAPYICAVDGARTRDRAECPHRTVVRRRSPERRSESSVLVVRHGTAVRRDLAQTPTPCYCSRPHMDGNRSRSAGRHRRRARSNRPSVHCGNPQWSDGSSETVRSGRRARAAGSWFEKAGAEPDVPAPDPAEVSRAGRPVAAGRGRTRRPPVAAGLRPDRHRLGSGRRLAGPVPRRWNVAGVAPENRRRRTDPGWDSRDQPWDYRRARTSAGAARGPLPDADDRSRLSGDTPRRRSGCQRATAGRTRRLGPARPTRGPVDREPRRDRDTAGATGPGWARASWRGEPQRVGRAPPGDAAWSGRLAGRPAGAAAPDRPEQDARLEPERPAAQDGSPSAKHRPAPPLRIGLFRAGAGRARRAGSARLAVDGQVGGR
jgi:hypothetical protein